MVRHIVLWSLTEGSAKEKLANAKRMKSELEGLKDRIDGIVQITVEISPLASSNRDIMLDSLFVNEAAFEAYKTHPEHVRAGEFVRAVTGERAAFDCVV